VADEHNLDVQMAMANAPSGAQAFKQKQGAGEQDDVAASLRQN